MVRKWRFWLTVIIIKVLRDSLRGLFRWLLLPMDWLKVFMILMLIILKREFIMGLQFHPERMRHGDTDEFDYLGCTFAYKEFVKAVIAYQKKISGAPKLNQEMEKKRKIIVRSFSITKNMYTSGRGSHPVQDSDLEARAMFLEENTTLSAQHEQRLKQVGATVSNNLAYRKLKMNEDREVNARAIIGKMSIEQLSDMKTFYYMMGQLCSDTLETKLQNLLSE